MTETFATTVAAVAPVIVLAGLVEIAICERAMKTEGLNYTRVLDFLVEEARAAGTVEERSAIKKRFVDHVTSKIDVISVLGVAWITVIVLLANSEFEALSYLASENPGPDKQLAERLFRLTVAGMYMLVVTPAVRLYAATFQHMARSWRARLRFRKALRSAPQPSTDD